MSAKQFLVVDGKERPILNRFSNRRVFELPDDLTDRVSRVGPVQVLLRDQDGFEGWFHVTSLREVKEI